MNTLLSRYSFSQSSNRVNPCIISSPFSSTTKWILTCDMREGFLANDKGLINTVIMPNTRNCLRVISSVGEWFIIAREHLTN